MKLLIDKIKIFLFKNKSIGFLLLLITGFFAFFYKPAVCYPLQTGVVESVKESVYFGNVGVKSKRSFTLDIFIFNISGKNYRLTKVDNENYNWLVGKEVEFRHPKWSNTLFELVCNGEIINTIDWYFHRFIRWLILFILSLWWTVWALVKMWKTTPATIEIQDGIEEYSGKGWLIRKTPEGCSLSYTSRMDGQIKIIKIEESDFLLAKQGKMSLNGFYNKYGLM